MQPDSNSRLPDRPHSSGEGLAHERGRVCDRGEGRGGEGRGGEGRGGEGRGGEGGEGRGGRGAYSVLGVVGVCSEEM